MKPTQRLAGLNIEKEERNPDSRATSEGWSRAGDQESVREVKSATDRRSEIVQESAMRSTWTAHRGINVERSTEIATETEMSIAVDLAEEDEVVLARRPQD